MNVPTDTELWGQFQQGTAYKHREEIYGYLDTISKMVLEHGGDGSGVWISRYYRVNELGILAKKWAKEGGFWTYEEHKGIPHLYREQEYFIITNNRNLLFNNYDAVMIHW